MTIRHFRIFIAVASSESITQAARQLYISQPTVSVAIKELEDHYGTRFFERLNQRLKITEAGQSLLNYATHFISLFDDMEKIFQNPDFHGTLRIGSGITAGSYYLPKIIQRFQESCPEVKTQIRIDTAGTIEKELLSNNLDLALIEGSVHSSFLKTFPVFHTRYIAVCAPEHKLASADTIPLEEFVKEPLLFRSRNSNAFEFFSTLLSGYGYQVKTAWESTSLEARLQAAKCNLGIAILPEIMAVEELRSRRLTQIRIQNFDITSTISLTYHQNKYLSNDMQQFICFLTAPATEETLSSESFVQNFSQSADSGKIHSRI